MYTFCQSLIFIQSCPLPPFKILKFFVSNWKRLDNNTTAGLHFKSGSDLGPGQNFQLGISPWNLCTLCSYRESVKGQLKALSCNLSSFHLRDLFPWTQGKSKNSAHTWTWGKILKRNRTRGKLFFEMQYCRVTHISKQVEANSKNDMRPKPLFF